MELLEKLRDQFDEQLVYKDPQKTAFFLNLGLPSYLRDWILKHYSSPEGECDFTAVQNFISRRIPTTNDNWKELQNRIINDGEMVSILARINVQFDVQKRNIHFTLPDLGVPAKDTIIEPYDWDRLESQRSLLSSRPTWGMIDLAYRYPQLEGTPKIPGAIRLVGFKPFGMNNLDVDYYREVSRKFEFDEWLDVLLGAVDYNAQGFANRAQKIAILTRILPFIEKRLNLIELAPKGTGKSYLYGRVSRYGWLASGGKITRAKMFYDMNKKEEGLIAKNDFVVLDEVQTVSFDNDDELRSAFKGYLESGSCTVGSHETSSFSGFVLSGNISKQHMDEYDNMFTELPEDFHESALIDRFHGFIKGWDIPRMHEDMKIHGWGLNTEYFTSILHELRNVDYTSLFEDLLEFPDRADTRDVTAILRITSAYLKLFFPFVQTKEDLNYELFKEHCLDRAVRMRKIIKYQLGLLDPGEFLNKEVPQPRIKGYDC